MFAVHVPLPPRVDHRALNGEFKRQQTRARILVAATAVCQSRLDSAPALQDVTALAKVSRSTFYNHFTSLDDTLSALGEDLSRRHFEHLSERFEGVTRNAGYIQAMGLRATLLRAVRDRPWARLMIRTAAWTRDGVFSTGILAMLTEGRERGDFQFIDEQVALDQLTGLLTRSFASLHDGVADPLRYIDGAVQAVLQGLGCQPVDCADGLRFSRRLIDAEMLPDVFSSQASTTGSSA
jgi:AcrR family transcriptional regulator